MVLYLDILIDLNNGKSIDSILLDLLKLKEEGMVENQNYWNIQGVYLEHIRALQDLNNEDSVLKEEISTLESTSPSQKTVDILKNMEFFLVLNFLFLMKKFIRNIKI